MKLCDIHIKTVGININNNDIYIKSGADTNNYNYSDCISSKSTATPSILSSPSSNMSFFNTPNIAVLELIHMNSHR